MRDYLHHPVTHMLVTFLMGFIATALYYREKAIREGRMRYFRCKDCGREHALDPNGKWLALRTIEEIEAQEQRVKEAQKRFAETPMKRAPLTVRGIPQCLHDVPLDSYCQKCVTEHEPQEPASKIDAN